MRKFRKTCHVNKKTVEYIATNSLHGTQNNRQTPHKQTNSCPTLLLLPLCITATILVRLLFVQYGQPKPRNIPNNHTNVQKCCRSSLHNHKLESKNIWRGIYKIENVLHERWRAHIGRGCGPVVRQTT